MYAEVERRKAPSEPTTVVLGHRRHLSACAGAMTSPSQTLSVDLQAAVDSLALLPVHIRRESSHEAQIFTSLFSAGLVETFIQLAGHQN